MKKYYLLILSIFLTACQPSLSEPQDIPEVIQDSSHYEIATFSGGCFWCIEAAFQEEEGVIDAVSGFAGENEVNPSYEDVVYGKTGHREAVQVTYDPEVISYTDLLEIFWRQIDPTDPGGQFADRGFSYTTAIFWHNHFQLETAEKSYAHLSKSKKFELPIVTKILEFNTFYPAPDSHQDYYQNKPGRYNAYAKGSGRKGYIEETWSGVDLMLTEDTQGSRYQDYSPEKLSQATQEHVVLFFHADWCPTCSAFEKKVLAQEIPEEILILKVDYDTQDNLRKKYNIVSQTSFVLVNNDGTLLKRWIGGRDISSIQDKIADFEADTTQISRTYTKEELKSRLTPLQYRVTQEGGTEPPFDNLYWNHYEEGIYVDIVDGTALFSSTDKYKSGSGWPAFTRPIDDNFLTEEDDYKLLVKRTEIKTDASHLGHVFEDGPKSEWGLRYCINSAALDFIPKDQLEERGYNQYVSLFE